MKTFVETSENATKNRKWILVDATDQPVGRLASNVASILKGKNNPRYTPHADTGDFVVVVNAGQAKFTGKKLDVKKYYRHTGYIGGLKEESASELMKSSPETVIENAVKGMLPKNPLGRAQLKKLKVYSGSEHPHAAQQPVQQ